MCSSLNQIGTSAREKCLHNNKRTRLMMNEINGRSKFCAEIFLVNNLPAESRG